MEPRVRVATPQALLLPFDRSVSKEESHCCYRNHLHQLVTVWTKPSHLILPLCQMKTINPPIASSSSILIPENDVSCCMPHQK